MMPKLELFFNFNAAKGSVNVLCKVKWLEEMSYEIECNSGLFEYAGFIFGQIFWAFRLLIQGLFFRDKFSSNITSF